MNKLLEGCRVEIVPDAPASKPMLLLSLLSMCGLATIAKPTPAYRGEADPRFSRRGGSTPRKPKGRGFMKRGFRVHSCNKLRHARRVAEAA